MPPNKIDPTELPGRPCSIAATLQLIGDRWALLAIREVMFGNHQFSVIARNTGAPTDRLAARLRDLVAAGILERRPNPDAPRFDGYHLTAAGRDLRPVTSALLQWGDKWAVTSPPMVTRHHGHRLTARTVCSTCGEVVDPGDVSRETTVPGWNTAGPMPD